MAEQDVLRATRAVVFTAVCVLLASLGHGLAAGHAPAAAAIVAGAGAVGLAAARFTDRERSLTQIAAGVTAAQLGLHLLFNSIQAPGPAEHMHVLVTESAAPVTGGPQMWLAHFVAGLIAAWWLRGGEQTLWNACRRLIAVLAQPLGVLALPRPVADSGAPTPVSFEGKSPPSAIALRHSVIRRGPPVALFS